MTAFKLCSQSLVFKDNGFIITLFSSQPCIIKQFSLDTVFPWIIAGGDYSREGDNSREVTISNIAD